MAELSILTIEVENNTLTPLSSATPTILIVDVGRFGSLDGATNVTLEIAETRGLSFSGYDAIGPASNKYIKTFNVIVTLTDTEAFPDGYAYVEIVGLNGLVTDDSFNEVRQTVKVNIIDGWDADRAIPLTDVNFAEFNPYANTTNGLKRHFKLETDAELTGENNWNAIGSGNEPFSGSFDGNGHTITGLNINSPNVDMQGMFGRIGGDECFVSNLALKNAYILGGREVGGIAGYSEGLVHNCAVSGEILGVSTVGGVVGSNIGANLQDCYSLCKVSGSSGAVGGVAGQNYNGTVKCCYSTGAVQGRGIVGGIVGNTVGSEAETTNCIALNDGITTTGGYEYAGRVSGGNSGTMSSNYALVSTQVNYNKTIHKAVESSATGIDGANVSPDKIKEKDTWTNAKFVFDDKHWQVPTDNTMPHLFATDNPPWPKLSGNGTLDDPFWVYDADTLYKVLSATDGWNAYAHYIQLAHIDMSDASLHGNMTYYYLDGSYNGNLYTISNLTINRPDEHVIGMFGGVGTSGVLKNLGLINVSVTAGNQVGGIAAQNRGIISNCYVKGAVAGGGDVGGIAGVSTGKTENCYFDGTVKGKFYIGGVIGLVGYGDDTVTSNCYALGEVIAETDYAGGIAGYNNGTISKCYSKSNVSGASCVGGIAGYNYHRIESCYSEGDISARADSNELSLAGGVAGLHNVGTAKNCYSACNVKAEGMAVGGAIGYMHNGAVTECCFAMGTVISAEYLAGVTGYATAANIKSCVALNEYISHKESGYDFARRVKCATDTNQSSNVYARNDLPIYDGGRTDGKTKKIDSSIATTSGDEGKNVTQGTNADQYNNIAFWKGIGFDFNEAWIWDSTFTLHNGARGLPKLREAGISPNVQLQVEAIAPAGNTEQTISLFPHPDDIIASLEIPIKN